MTMDAPQPAEPRSRWMFYALIASLAANLLIVGWVGAAMWHHRHGPGGWRGGDDGLMGFVRQLPQERRVELRSRLKAARESLRPMREAVTTSWSAANATLGAEPFDKTAAKAAFQTAIEADAKMRARIDDEIIGLAETLNSEERKSLQAWRDKKKPRGFRHRKDKDERGPADDDAAPAPPAPPAQ